MSKRLAARLVTTLAISASVAAAVRAETGNDAAAPRSASGIPVTQGETTTGAAASLFGADSQPQPAETLVELRGRGGLGYASLVAGNQVIFNGPANVAQSNAIDGSFNGASGVFTVVQNAGNNTSLVVQTNVWINIAQ